MIHRSVAGFVLLESNAHISLSLNNPPVLCGLRKPQGQMGGRWELPGGKVEGNESDEECLIREFGEELGVLPRIGQKIGSVDFLHKNKKFVVHGYLVYIKEEPIIHPEHDVIKWMTLEFLLGSKLVDSDRLLIQRFLF